MAIGILGGTFNPVHIGHLILAQEVGVKMNLSKVIFIPAKIPPLKKVSTTATHRYNMVKIAISDNSLFEISDIELKSNQISYTYQTICKLKTLYNEPIIFIIGADNILSLPDWHRWQDLIEECEIVIVSRPNYSFEHLSKLKDKISPTTYQKLKQNLIDIPLVLLSSSIIRQKCNQGIPIKYLVPKGVSQYIHKHKLYQNVKI